MTTESIMQFLLWCTVINYGVLLVWFIFFALLHDRVFRLHSLWFRLHMEQFDMLHYGSMAVFKIGIILFNLVPLIALCIVR